MAFEAFDQDKKGSIGTDKVGTILEMLGHQINSDELNGIIYEVDTWGKYDIMCMYIIRKSQSKRKYNYIRQLCILNILHHFKQ